MAEDPPAAYAHAVAARRLAGRLPVVREAVGITAYRTGRFAEALSELRAYTRMTGDIQHLPVMADCERGLGRPERALALARGGDVGRLGSAERVELRIVTAGARSDRGEHEAALVELRGPELDATDVRPWTVRLWYAYADTLLAAGRAGEAAHWFRAAATVDEHDETDAEDRAQQVEGE